MEFDISWEELEHRRKRKSSDWYWALWIIAVSATLISLIIGNILFAVLIVISGFALSIHASKTPKVIFVGINEKGIAIGKIFYPYSKIKSFRIQEEYLILTTKKMHPSVSAPLSEKIEPETIQEYLKNHIEEQEESEISAVDFIVKKLGF